MSRPLPSTTAHALEETEFKLSYNGEAFYILVDITSTVFAVLSIIGVSTVVDDNFCTYLEPYVSPQLSTDKEGISLLASIMHTLYSNVDCWHKIDEADAYLDIPHSVGETTSSE